MKYRERLPEGARVFQTSLPVQWADIDYAGIMYFAAYLRFAERAEMEFFGELGFPYDSVFQTYSFWLPRVHLEAEYHAPALMNDVLRMRTNIEHVGASSVRWRTVVFNERTKQAGAEFVFTVACMDRESLGSRRLPEDIRSALLACLPPVTPPCA